MNLFWFLVNFYLVFIAAFEIESLKTKTHLATAVNEVINEVNFGEITTINFIYSKSSENEAFDFANELLLKSFGSMKVFRLRPSMTYKPKGKKRFMVIAVATYIEFIKTYKQLSPKVFWFGGYYLIILTNGEIVEIQQVFALLWKLQIFNVNVMFEDENGEVLVQTFMPFNAQNCNDTTPILINKFKNGKFINGTENFFPKKIKNLHNCPVRISISKSDEPFIFSKLLENGSYEISGSDINLIKSLSSALNFKIDFTYIGDEGFFYENGTSDGPLRALLDEKADLSLSGWWLKANRLNFFDHTTSHISDQIVFVIPPGHDLSSFEELVFPFSKNFWVMILLCFAFGFTVIFIIKRQKKVVQNFVFGTGVRTPYLNLFIAFIGGAQKKLPGRNFARFMLMMFLMYSLVIRTLYQASFYKLLKSNIKHPEVQSIDEMIKKDFKFYVYYGIEDLVNATDAMKNR
jgi:Ligated ion channel L-glutamate- and glycine-binding site